jgi:hypothetical protein
MARSHCAVHPALVPIAVADGVASLLNSGLGAAESARFGRALRRVPRPRDPVFVLGHWRCGTTLLHELLALDSGHAAPTLYQCLAPHHFLLTGRWLPRFLRPLVPERRPMDEMSIDLSGPCEDEFALCLLGARSPYQTLAFPNSQRMERDQFDPAAFRPAERTRWIRAIDLFTRKLAVAAPRRRLVLKSPPHSVRIRTLLELFPEARFVRIVRNPVAVFPSTMHTWRQLSRAHGWQRPNHRGLAETVLDLFLYFEDAWERDRDLIAEGRVHQLRYEDLVAHPVTELARLYRALALDLPRDLEGSVTSYFARRRHFQTNRFALPPATARLVNERWRVAIERQGYREAAA